MSEDPGRETRLIDIKGRQIVVRQLVDAQIALLARERQMLLRDSVSVEQKINSVARMINILESAVVQPDDREYLMDVTVAGELEMKDLLQVITVFNDQPTAPVKAVRRGRPPIKR